MNDNSFYSIDRLMEFGMGMAMAQQMVKVMNDTMQTMHVPGAANTISSPKPLTIYVGIDGRPVGPLSEKEFSNLISEHKVTKDSLVWVPGMLGWKPLEELPDVLKIIALMPPPLPNND